jgi:hypothetical protein
MGHNKQEVTDWVPMHSGPTVWLSRRLWSSASPAEPNTPRAGSASRLEGSDGAQVLHGALRKAPDELWGSGWPWEATDVDKTHAGCPEHSGSRKSYGVYRSWPACPFYLWNQPRCSSDCGVWPVTTYGHPRCCRSRLWSIRLWSASLRGPVTIYCLLMTLDGQGP